MAVIPKDFPELLHAFRQQMDELFEGIFQLERKGAAGERETAPLVDCFETAGEFVMEIELPGFCREDLSLGIIRDTLIVEGIKREEEKEKAVNYICLERSFGLFRRTIQVPSTVDVSRARASYRNGILYVTFPKIDETRAIIREIPIE